MNEQVKYIYQYFRSKVNNAQMVICACDQCFEVTVKRLLGSKGKDNGSTD